jgi:transitional endoplasmic reticulum ATPase
MTGKPMAGEETLRALREALQLSPDNLPLRQHLADTLFSIGRYEEAEQEYRTALSQSPDNQRLKSGLAKTFYQQEKYTPAMVLLENLMKVPDADADLRVLYAKLLARAGDVENAVRQYVLAIETDPKAADEDFAERLGIDADPDGSVVDGKVRANDSDDLGILEDIERPKTRFENVGGMEVVKEEIRLKILYPLTNPEMYRAYGKTIGGGILMYGPPGCGKTHLARATAGEIQAAFISVGINDVLDMWIGNSERNLHSLFDQARRNQPCVLFFDEVDALAANRTDMRGGGARQLINQFLAELDGVQTSNEGVLILAATNAPWHLDPAFRRPGRFDRILFVPPPDAAARESILRIHLKGKPLKDIEYSTLTQKTENFSGADLKAVVDVAVERKLQEAMRSGVPLPLTTKDLLAASASLKPSTREWFSSARNYALYANQGGLYDDILKYLKL